MRNLKKFLALALAMMMVFSLFVTVNAATPAFTDAAEASTVYQDALKALSAVGAMKGYDDGSVDPAKPIARKEFAAMLYRLISGDVEEKEAGQYAQYAAVFTDVGTNKWYSGPVGYLYHNNIMVGMSDTEFGKDKDVKAEQVIIALLRAVGLVVNDKELTDENPSGLSWGLVVNMAMNRANEYNLNAGVATKELSGAVTREVVAQLIFNAFTSPKYYPDPYATRPDRFVATKDTLGAAVGLVEDDSVPASAKDDPYGRPDATKVIPIGEDDYIITEREDTLIASFEGKTKAGDAVTALKAKSVTQFANGVKVYINGSTSNAGNDSNTIADGSKLGGKALDVKFANTAVNNDKPWKNKGVLDYYTSSDNTTVEVYAKETTTTDSDGNTVGTGKYEITRIVSINTFVTSAPLTKNQIVAAKGTTKAGIMLEGKKFETTDTYEVGDVVLYTKGLDDTEHPQTANTVIMSAKKADSFEGKLDSVTSKNGYTYTIDGVNYTASDAVGGSITTTDLAGKDCVFYYLTDNDTKYLVYAELKPAEDGKEEAAETGYIYVTAHSKTTETNTGDIVSGKKVYTAQVYGITGAGDVDYFDVKVSKEWLSDTGKEGIYSYKISDGVMELTEIALEAASGLDTVKVVKDFAAGAVEVTYSSPEKKADLNTETSFVYWSIKSGKEIDTSKVAVKTGSRNIGGGIDVAGDSTLGSNDSHVAYVCVDSGVAKVVFVKGAYVKGANDADASDVYLLIDVKSEVTETVTTSATKSTTTWTYDAITSEGEKTTITISSEDDYTSLQTAATGTTGYAVAAVEGVNKEQKWVAYEMLEDGSVGNELTENTYAFYGKYVTEYSGSTVEVETNASNLKFASDKAQVASMTGGADKLAKGQKIVYVVDGNAAGKNILAAWIVADAVIVEATINDSNKATYNNVTWSVSGATTAGAAYTVKITLNSKEFVATPDGTAKIKNYYTVTVTSDKATTRAETVTVTMVLQGKDSEGNWKINGAWDDDPGYAEVPKTVSIGANAKTGSATGWFACSQDVKITPVITLISG